MMYRFVSKTLSNKLNSIEWNCIQGKACHITNYSNNLFSDIFIKVQQPVSKGSYGRANKKKKSASVNN